MRLLINIPAYNEEKTLKDLIEKLPRRVDGFREVKIQIIDDGSRDNTRLIAIKTGADFVFSHKINRGLGKAFREAILKSLENGFDVMINIDADGQFDPTDIPKLVKPILEKKSDIVIGSRFSGIKPVNMPFLRKFLNMLAAKIVGIFLGCKTDDITCGFRAYNQEAMLRLNLTHQFTYTQETIIDALGKDLKIQWIPIKVSYFKNRKAKLTKSINTFIYQSVMIIFKTLRDTKPLKFFGMPALIMIFSSLVIFATFGYFYIQTLKITPYRNWLGLASILLLLGIQFLVFAFLADMIKSSRKLAEDEMYENRKHKYLNNKESGNKY